MRIGIWVVALCIVGSIARAGAEDAPRRPLTPEETLAESRAELAPVESAEIPFDHSTLSLTLRGSAPGSFDGRDYQDGGASLAGSLSLYSRLRAYGDRPQLFRLSAQFRVEGEQVKSDLIGDQRVTKASLGLTALYVSPKLNMYALYVGAGVAESRDTLSSPRVMPSVIGLGTARLSETVMLLYGGGFGYALGRAWLLPIAGVNWKLARTWKVGALLPLVVYATHAFSRRASGSFVIAASGDRFDFTNRGAVPGASDRLQLRLGQARVGVSASYRFSLQWSVRGELGVVGPRALAIVDGDTEVISSTSKGVAYLSTSITYGFGNAWI